MAMNDKKLKKLKMPMKASPEKDMMDELVMEEEGMMDEEMPMESEAYGEGEMGEEMMGKEEMDKEMPDLMSVSDNELLAELKKRGLSLDEEEEDMDRDDSLVPPVQVQGGY